MKSRRMRWVVHVARIGRGEAYTGFWWGKREGKRPLGTPRFRWDDLQEVGCGGMDWIELAQCRDRWRALVNAANESSGYIKCGEFLD
jgi:hypothetical protein